MIVSADMISNLNQAFLLLQQHQQDKIKQGEKILLRLRDNVSYPIVLFEYMQTHNEQQGLRAAIELKLWCKQYANMDELHIQYLQESVMLLKKNLIMVYVKAPQSISIQLRESLLYLIQKEYPLNWMEFINEVGQALLIPEFTYKILKLVRKFTNKYSYLGRSDPLYLEINQTCDGLHNPLIQLAILQTQRPDFKNLHQLLKIFYNLNYQDLHPAFEENIQQWMEFLKYVLTIQGFQQSEIFKSKGAALQCVLLYTTRYKEDFKDIVNMFCQEIWAICASDQKMIGNEKITSNALKYFKALVNSKDMTQFFQSNVPLLMQHLIIPYISIGKNEADLFQSEPSSFIELYFDYGIMDHIKTTAADLYKSIVKFFRPQVEQYLIEKISQFYSVSQDIHSEMVIISMLIEGSITSFSAKDGIIEFGFNSDIPSQFYEITIKKKLEIAYNFILQADGSIGQFQPIMLALYCRYIHFFKYLIPKQDLIVIALVISKFQIIGHQTLQEVAQLTLTSILNMKQDPISYLNRDLYFNSQSCINISNELQQMFADVYQAINLEPSQQALKLARTLISLLQNQLFVAINPIIELLKLLLTKLKQNYEFEQAKNVFELFSNLIEQAILTKSPAIADQIQRDMLEQLDEMLRENKGDVACFILQIYALLNEIQTNASPYYQGLFKSILDPINWDTSNQSIFPAYIAFFTYWFKKNPVPPEIQQVLRALAQSNLQSYTLLSQLLIRVNQQWIPLILSVIFEQYLLLNSGQAAKLKVNNLSQKLINKEILLIISEIANRYQADTLFRFMNQFQPQLLEKFLYQEVQVVEFISARYERTVILKFLTTLMFKEFAKISQQTWDLIFVAVVNNFYTKKKNPLAHVQNIQERDEAQQSGFFALHPVDTELRRSKFLHHDEEPYFKDEFKKFLAQNPQRVAQLGVSNLLDESRQIYLSQMVK
ncbi:hypothetical protein pb186bvf_008502 [Paramecium bursaria]